MILSYARPSNRRVAAEFLSLLFWKYAQKPDEVPTPTTALIRAIAIDSDIDCPPLTYQVVSFQIPAIRPQGRASFQTPPSLTYGIAFLYVTPTRTNAPAIVVILDSAE